MEILNAKHAVEHAKNMRKSGRKPKLCMEDKLLATLEYLREYRTMAHIAASYGVAESNIHETIRWVENTLVKDGTFGPELCRNSQFLGLSLQAIARVKTLPGLCRLKYWKGSRSPLFPSASRSMGYSLTL